MSEPRRKGPKQSDLLAAAGQYTGYGLGWVFATGLFMGGGWWLDGKIGTVPLFTIIGAFVGGGAGFYSLYRHIVMDPRRENEDGEP